MVPPGDFRILVLATWNTMFESYPGRLVVSFEQPTGTSRSDEAFSSLRVGRLPLPALLRSGKYNPRPGDEKRSKWEEVALGSVTPSLVGKWISEAGQDAALKQIG